MYEIPKPGQPEHSRRDGLSATDRKAARREKFRHTAGPILASHEYLGETGASLCECGWSPDHVYRMLHDTWVNHILDLIEVALVP